MKYLVLLFLLSSCANIVEEKFRTFNCKMSVCSYKKGKGVSLYEEINTNGKDSLTLAIAYSRKVCLVGLSFDKSVYSKEDILEFNHRLGADYILHTKVFDDQIHGFDEYLVSEPYKASIVYFYVSKDRADKCFDILEE